MIVKMNENGMLYLPPYATDRLSLRSGDALYCLVEKDSICLTPTKGALMGPFPPLNGALSRMLRLSCLLPERNFDSHCQSESEGIACAFTRRVWETAPQVPGGGNFVAGDRH